MELSSKETPIRVLMDHPEGRGKRFCIRARRVAVPFAIGPLKIFHDRIKCVATYINFH